MALHSRSLDAPADPEALYESLYEMGVTDGLPVIPPTDERVERFVRVTGLAGTKEIARIPPLNGSATVEKIAINAVMAGCRADYMPVVMTALRAMTQPAFNFLGIQTTTNPVGPMIIVNGPIRQRLEINCGRNALGPGRRANATIGRAVRLAMLNIGGASPEEVDKSTLGMPGKYTMCLGENEEESPWDPYHVDRGFRREQSTVTVLGPQGTQNIYTPWKKADSILRAWSSAMISLAANNTLRGQGHPILIVNPGHARLLADQGFDKPHIQRELWERSAIKACELPSEVSAIEAGSRKMINGLSMVTARPEDILIIVAGGPEAYHNTYCETFGDWAVTELIALEEKATLSGP
jgi:hypothetical protein